MNVWLQNKSWKETEHLIKKSMGVAIFPIGSIEQHGYHLPLGTDSYVAMTLAEEAASKTNALLVPPVWYGWSPHHMVLPGTMSIRAEVLIEFVYDMISSVNKHGIDKIVLLNGHRIVNVVWMQILAEKAQRELGVIVKVFDPAYMSKEILNELDFNTVGHADEIETSHMMYRYPELVQLELAKDNPIVNRELYSVDPAYRHDTLCYVPSTIEHAKKTAILAGGTTGEPSKSDPNKGEKYHNHLVENLCKIIGQLQNK